MKVTILTSNLQEKVSLANHAISSRSQLPVLLNLFLEAKKGALYIKSTDLEIGIETKIQANIDEDGSTTVPSKIFSELLNTLSSDKVTLETKDKNLLITADKVHATLATIQADEFPSLYDEKGEEMAKVGEDHLSKEFQKILFAASVDTTRPALSGVLIKPEEKGCLMVATDGYRLSLKKLPVAFKKTGEDEDREGKPLLVPARILREVVAEKESGDLSLFVSSKNNQVIFEQGDTLILGRLIDATFPEYEKIIPANHTTRVIVDKEELLKAVKLSALFARDGSNIVKFSVGKKGVELFAQTASLGENRVEVEGRVDGEGGEIAFNAKYLLDVLSHIDTETIVFEMTGPLAPGVFKVEGDDTFIHLIMPIRVQNE